MFPRANSTKQGRDLWDVCALCDLSRSLPVGRLDGAAVALPRRLLLPPSGTVPRSPSVQRDSTQETAPDDFYVREAESHPGRRPDGWAGAAGPAGDAVEGIRPGELYQVQEDTDETIRRVECPSVCTVWLVLLCHVLLLPRRVSVLWREHADYRRHGTVACATVGRRTE